MSDIRKAKELDNKESENPGNPVNSGNPANPASPANPANPASPASPARTEKSDKPGKILLLVAPSGAGKSTMAQRLLSDFPDLRFSVSATTRPPRAGEVHGRDYHFLSPQEFQEKIDLGEFLEWEEFYGGRRYGTLREDVDKWLGEGFNILMDLEILGASNVKNMYRDRALGIFIKPPSLEELRRRLELRGESGESLKLRLERAGQELARADDFDLSVINDDLETAYRQIRNAVSRFFEGRSVR